MERRWDRRSRETAGIPEDRGRTPEGEVLGNGADVVLLQYYLITIVPIDYDYSTGMPCFHDRSRGAEVCLQVMDSCGLHVMDRGVLASHRSVLLAGRGFVLCLQVMDQRFAYLVLL